MGDRERVGRELEGFNTRGARAEARREHPSRCSGRRHIFPSDMTDQFDRPQAALAGRYAIERELGAGGMATAYLSRDLEHDRHVAVKVMKLLRVNPRLGQLTVAEATAVPNVGLPTDRRAAALAVVQTRSQAIRPPSVND